MKKAPWVYGIVLVCAIFAGLPSFGEDILGTDQDFFRKQNLKPEEVSPKPEPAKPETLAPKNEIPKTDVPKAENPKPEPPKPEKTAKPAPAPEPKPPVAPETKPLNASEPAFKPKWHNDIPEYKKYNQNQDIPEYKKYNHNQDIPEYTKKQVIELQDGVQAQPEESLTSDAENLDGDMADSANAPEPTSEELKKLKEPQFIQHPDAAKGLIKIEKDNTYVYDLPPSPSTRAASVQFGYYAPKLLQNPTTGVYFKDLYDGGGAPVIFIDYNWRLFSSAGTLLLSVGSGIFAANGHGQFENQVGLKPREVFSFFIFPNNAALTWRAQFWDKQWIVPYGTGGVDPMTFAELRDDGKSPKLGAALAAHFAGGASFNISALDRRSLLDLDREYGINGLWLNVEFRQVVSLSSKYDLSAQVVSGGFLMEY